MASLFKIMLGLDSSEAGGFTTKMHPPDTPVEEGFEIGPRAKLKTTSSMQMDATVIELWPAMAPLASALPIVATTFPENLTQMSGNDLIVTLSNFKNKDCP
jgi:hypothetical protein